MLNTVSQSNMVLINNCKLDVYIGGYINMEEICGGLLYWYLIRDMRAVMYLCVLGWKVCISIINCGLDVMWML